MMNDYVMIRKNVILTDEGRLFNAITGEEIFLAPNGSGRVHISLRCKQTLLHHLVMQYFGYKKPAKNYIIDHVDRDPLNNAIWNLRWVTPSGNNYNKSNNLPIGERLCDSDPLTYRRTRTREYMRKIRAKAKGFSSWEEYQNDKLRNSREID